MLLCWEEITAAISSAGFSPASALALATASVSLVRACASCSVSRALTTRWNSPSECSLFLLNWYRPAAMTTSAPAPPVTSEIQVVTHGPRLPEGALSMRRYPRSRIPVPDARARWSLSPLPGRRPARPRPACPGRRTDPAGSARLHQGSPRGTRCAAAARCPVSRLPSGRDRLDRVGMADQPELLL